MNGLGGFLSPEMWPAFVLASARAVGVMLVAPIWSMQAVPMHMRLALGLVLGLALAGAIGPINPQAAGFLIAPMVVELFVGTMIGLVVAAFLYGVQVASEVSSVQMGLAMAASFAPGSGIGGPGIGTVVNLFVLGIYLLLGGHLILLGGLAESFSMVPPASSINLGGLHHVFLDVVAGVFVTAVRVAAPLMAAMMLANVLLGILSKAVPQINTLMVAFPITITLGFVTLLASLPLLLMLTRQWVGGLDADVWRVLTGARGY